MKDITSVILMHAEKGPVIFGDSWTEALQKMNSQFMTGALNPSCVLNIYVREKIWRKAELTASIETICNNFSHQIKQSIDQVEADNKIENWEK